MDNAAYKDWVDIFDSDISKIWSNEREELQRSAMLLKALQKEFERVQNNINAEVLELKRNLESRDNLKQSLNSVQSSTGNQNKENVHRSKPALISMSREARASFESPDLFNDIGNLCSGESESTTNDLESLDATRLDSSPTLSKSNRYFKRRKSEQPKIASVNRELNTIKKDIFKTPKSEDDTVITCTPGASCHLVGRKINNTGNKRVRKKVKNTTLTQIFAKSSMIEDTKEEDEELDMAITDILMDINRDSNDENESCNDSTCSINAFSKGGFLDDSDLVSPKKQKMMPTLRPIVVGVEKKEPVGFSCQKCKNFYPNEKLAVGAFKNECCKRNFLYKQPEETMAGFWDLTFSSQVNEVRK